MGTDVELGRSGAHMTDLLLRVLEFVRLHGISMMFALIFLSIVAYVIRLHFSKQYEHFKFAQLIMKADGTLDRKAFYKTMLFVVCMYGCVEVLHHHPDLVLVYFNLQAAIWLGTHLA